MQHSSNSQPSHTQKFLRQRKLLLILPFFLLPFVTFLLWSLGIIGSSKAQGQDAQTKKGLNMSLPAPTPSKDSTWNKLNFYDQADKDAAKLASLLENDPYYNSPITAEAEPADTSLSSELPGYHEGALNRNNVTSASIGKPLYDSYPRGLVQQRDPNEEKVYQKLAELNEQLNKATKQQKSNYRLMEREDKTINPSVNTADIDRLENMMQLMQDADATGDPELQQLSGMLDKIMAIQHPDKAMDELKQQSIQNKQQVFPVTVTKEEGISLLRDRATQDTLLREDNVFYALDDVEAVDSQAHNTIRALIPETQTFVNGSTVKLRLVSEVYINGIQIPKDQYIYGEASLNHERLEITINSIRYGNDILPVALSVYDLDGLSGIYMPGSIIRDVSKESAQQAMQGLGIASLDPSLAAQAASTGIEAAKSLLTKKAKLVKVTVKAGYQVLLRDNYANKK